MSDVVVVYESDEPFWVEEVMGVLQDEGFHPALADDAGAEYYRMDNKSPGILGMPQGRMKLRIVVPQEEEAAVRSFLQKREKRSGRHAAAVAGRLRRPLVLSALGTTVAFLIMAFWGQPDSEELLSCLGLAVLTVLPASFILTANVGNTIGQICVVTIPVVAVVGGMYCWDRALIWTGCCLWALPVVGIAYIFLRSHKYVRSHKCIHAYKKNDSSQIL